LICGILAKMVILSTAICADIIIITLVLKNRQKVVKLYEKSHHNIGPIGIEVALRSSVLVDNASAV
jgi:hypothetical protein